MPDRCSSLTRTHGRLHLLDPRFSLGVAGITFLLASYAGAQSVREIDLGEWTPTGRSVCYEVAAAPESGFGLVFRGPPPGQAHPRHDAGALAEFGGDVRLEEGESLRFSATVDVAGAPLANQGLRIGFEHAGEPNQTVLFALDTGKPGGTSLQVNSTASRNEFTGGHKGGGEPDDGALAATDRLDAGNSVPLELTLTRGAEKFTADWTWGGWSSSLEFRPQTGTPDGRFDKVFVVTNDAAWNDPAHALTFRDIEITLLGPGVPSEADADADPDADDDSGPGLIEPE